MLYEVGVFSLLLGLEGVEQNEASSQSMNGWMGADWYTERYFELLKESKIRGYLFEQQNYVPKQ